MPFTLLEFAGFSAGVTDFGQLLAQTVQPALPELETVLDVVARQLRGEAAAQPVAVVVLGCSDRQDRADLGCDARRQSETDASWARARSAEAWIKARVAEKAGVAGEWWDAVPGFAGARAGTGAAMLAFEAPGSEAERAANRRVLILVNVF